jgi:LmbE family N-acetylglucosaminyl deacetylase
MISRRPFRELSGEEFLLYDSIDGHKTVAQLEELHPGARDLLLAWREAELIELIAPIAPAPRPHLVVIEPHMDDAALSVGGRLLNRRGSCRVTILSVMKWSNFTSYLTLGRNFVNVQEVTDLRVKESVLASQLLGAEHHCLDWKEATLRTWPAERWSPAIAEKYEREGYLFTVFIPDPKEVSLLAEDLARDLAALAPDELWIPMGTSNHGDHRTTRNACLLMLSQARQRFSGVSVSMYEDLPYASISGHAEQIRGALSEPGACLIRHTEDVTDVFEEKLRAISVYASQFKLAFIEPKIRRLAEREGAAPGKLGETYHCLEGEVSLPPEMLLARESRGMMAFQSGVQVLLTKDKKWRRVTVMALPTGSLMRWKTDGDFFAATFPNADLRVYAPEEMIWQTEDGEHDGNARLRLVRVRGLLGWVGVIGRELFSVGTPTFVLWRGAYGALPHRNLKKLFNIFIKSLLPFRRVLFARALRDLCLIQDTDFSAVRGDAEK